MPVIILDAVFLIHCVQPEQCTILITQLKSQITRSNPHQSKLYQCSFKRRTYGFALLKDAHMVLFYLSALRLAYGHTTYNMLSVKEGFGAHFNGNARFEKSASPT